MLAKRMWKQDESEIDKAAKEYATHASKAPDKETPDWIITDFKAGAKWERENGRSKELLEMVVDYPKKHYITSRLKRYILDYLGLPF